MLSLDNMSRKENKEKMLATAITIFIFTILPIFAYIWRSIKEAFTDLYKKKSE
jgi:hypothetical protein